MSRITRYLVTICVVVLGFSTIQPPAYAQNKPSGFSEVGAPDPDATTDVTIYVNGQHPSASDANKANNSPELPLLTVKAGIDFGLSKTRLGQSVTVLVSPGTYREGLSIYPNNTGKSLFVLKAEIPGTVSIKASDIWDSWREYTSDIFIHDWPFDWGTTPTPTGWPTVPKVAARQEIILVDKQNLEQTFKLTHLTPGSFMVDQTENVVYVNPPAGVTDLNSATVEVGIRESTLNITRDNVVVSGLKFLHSRGSIIRGQGVWVGDASRISFKDVEFVHNGSTGLGLGQVRNAYFQNVTASNNGSTGTGGSRLQHLLFEDITTSFNNWRGVRGGFTGWSVAGIKHLYAENVTYRRVQSTDNHAHGYWCDTACINVHIDDGRFLNNRRAGVYLEASPGPLNLTNSVSANNLGPGILASNADNASITDSILYGNRQHQLLFTGERTGRPAVSWITGQEYTTHFRNWYFRRNFIQSKYPISKGKWLVASTFPTGYWNKKIKSHLNSNDNIWFNAYLSNSFGAWSGHALNFDGWKILTGQDNRSLWRDPGFKDPDNNDFSRI